MMKRKKLLFLLFAMLAFSTAWANDVYLKVDPSKLNSLDGKEVILAREYNGTNANGRKEAVAGAFGASNVNMASVYVSSIDIDDRINFNHKKWENNYTNVTIFKLHKQGDYWTLSIVYEINGKTGYLAAKSKDKTNLDLLTDPSKDAAQWEIQIPDDENGENGCFLVNKQFGNIVGQGSSASSAFNAKQPTSTTYNKAYLFVKAEAELNVEPETLDLGYESSATFNVNGSSLTEEISVSIKDGSTAGFSVNPENIAIGAEGNVNQDVTVEYSGTERNASGTIIVQSGLLPPKEIAVTAKLLIPELSVSTNTVQLGNNPSKTFTVSGGCLTSDVSISIKEGSNEGFSVAPTTITPTNGEIDGEVITISYNGTTTGARATIVVSSGDLIQEVSVIASPPKDTKFTTPGNYYIQNKSTGNYVRLVNTTLADVTATSEEEADVIALDFYSNGEVKIMEQFDGDADMIATLQLIKNSMKEVLEEGGLPTNFLNKMFTMKMVYTKDNDGSVYLVVDVPEIPNWNAIRDYLIAHSGGNIAVNFYLSHMESCRRHYLCVDYDDTFGFTLDNDDASKWQVNIAEDELFTTPGNYYINNKKTGKYVKLENSQLATVTADTEAEADIIALDFNETGAISVMEQYNGDGDMIATLNLIKSSMKEVLEQKPYPTDFLDQMFTLKMVKTKDSDGSVYLVVDVPRISDWNNIRNYLIQNSGGNAAINFYLNNMEEGKRHYLCVDTDYTTFSLKRNNGDASKWMVTLADGNLFTTPGNYYVKNKGNGKYVIINGTYDATASADNTDNADIITLDFDELGIVSVMEQYQGDGNLIAILNTVKRVLKEKLEGNNMNADFVEEMFKIKLVETGDDDGSIYFCFDIPKIDNIDEIRQYLLGSGISNQLVKDYLEVLLQPRKRVYLYTTNDNGTFGFTLDGSTNATKWQVEAAEIPEDVLFTTPGNYYVNNKGIGKYVVINGTYDATASAASTDEADIITIGFNEDGTVRTMKNYVGDGDLIATLEIVKSVLREKLEGNNMNADFVDEMFKIKLVDTGDGDGSMYFCFDIPSINNIDEIREYLLGAGINNQLVKDYLEVLLQPRKRVYLCTTDDNGTFGFTRDGSIDASKWQVEKAPDQLFTEAGSYYINNKGNNQYVVINGAYDADVSATSEDNASIIDLAFDEQTGYVAEMKNHNGEGDVMTTLETVKEVLKNKLGDLISEEILDDIFEMSIAETGDGDGSVFLCLDIPAIDNIDAIRAAAETNVNNATVREYLDVILQPGKRVYMCVNSDDNVSLGFTLDNGDYSKWMVTKLEKIEINEENFPDPVFRQYVHDTFDLNGNWWLSQAELDLITRVNIDASKDANLGNIKDLTGIEYFINLKTLILSGSTDNKLSLETLDVSELQNIENLYCFYGSKLTNINVSGLTKLTIFQVQHQDALTRVDLSDNNNLVKMMISNNPVISEINIPKNSLTSIKEFFVEVNPNLRSQTFDFSENTTLEELRVNLNGGPSTIVGVSSQMDNLRYVNTQHQLYEGNVLDVSGCTKLHNLSVIGCNLDKLNLAGCTELGMHGEWSYPMPFPNTGVYFYDNHLRALDLTGVQLDYNFNVSPKSYADNETLGSDYIYNDVNKYFLPDKYVYHADYNEQYVPTIKPLVAYLFYENYNPENPGAKTHTYAVYVSLDSGGDVSDQDTNPYTEEDVPTLNDIFRQAAQKRAVAQAEEYLTTGDLEENPNILEEIAEGVTDVGFDYKRVKRWSRFAVNYDNAVTAQSNLIQLIHGTKGSRMNNLRPRAAGENPPTELDPTEVKGEILLLGIYTIPEGEKDAKVSGTISYMYNTRTTVDNVDVDNPGNNNPETITDRYDKRNYYKKQTLVGLDEEMTAADGVNPDYDNTFPVEFNWEITLSDTPEEIVTGLTKLDPNREVAKITYVNMMGIESDRPFEGVNIVVTHYTDGSVTTTKVIR